MLFLLTVQTENLAVFQNDSEYFAGFKTPT